MIELLDDLAKIRVRIDGFASQLEGGIMSLDVQGLSAVLVQLQRILRRAGDMAERIEKRLTSDGCRAGRYRAPSE